MISYEFDLQVTPGAMPPILKMAQYDSGRWYTANLKNGATAFQPQQGTEAKIKGLNAAGVAWEQEATLSSSSVTFNPSGAATDQFGVMPVQLELARGDDVISTLLIIFDIQKAGYTNEEAVRSPEFQSAMDEAVATRIPASSFRVNITYSGGAYHSDKTAAQIVAAAAEGCLVYANTPDGTAYYSGDGETAAFQVIDTSGGSSCLCEYSVTASSVTRSARLLYEKPTGGVPKTDLAQDVQTALDAVSVVYHTITNLQADVTPGIIYTALVTNQKPIWYALTDAVTKIVYTLQKRPDNSSEAIFVGWDAANNAISLCTMNSTGGVSYASIPAGGGGGDTAKKAAGIYYATVGSSSTSTAFVASITGITELVDGVCVMLKNNKVNSASGCTLNVNSLGAKPIYSSLAASTAVGTTFKNGYTMLFVYDSTRVSGGCWVMYYGYDSNTTYNNVALGHGHATCSTAEATTAKTASLSNYALTTGGNVTIKFTNAVPASATLNINSKGAKAIYYRGAAITAGVIKAGDIALFRYDGSYYHLIAIDRAAIPSRVINTLVAIESSGTYTGSGANFTFNSLDDIIALANNGEQFQLAISNTGDVYPLIHVQGAASTARLYFGGLTWGNGMTRPQVDVFELDSAGVITNVSSVNL